MKRAGTTNGRLLVISILGSAFAAGTLALGMHYAGLETYPLLASMPYRKLVFYLLIAALFFAACLGIYQFGKHGKKLIDTLGRKNPLPAVSITFSAKSIVASTVVVLVLWLPWIAVEYPASIDWDTYNQLYQFFTPAPTYYSTMGTVFDAEYIDHHPVFDTLIFGSFVWLGNVVGSQNMGMFLYALLQCAFTAAALSLSCCYLDKLGVPKPIRLSLLVFVAIFPPIPNWAMCMCKDSLFSAVFILYFVAFIEIVRTKGAALGSKRFLACYVILSGLCILTKKPGVYIFILSGFVLLVVYRRFWKRTLVALIAPLLLFSFAFPAVVYPLIGGVASGGKQEMLGTFFQQTATYLLEHDDATAEELETIKKVMNIDAAKERWNPQISDPAKNSFQADASFSDIVDYFKVWAIQGTRHPVSYLKATCCTNVQGFSPAKTMGWHTTCNPGKSALEMFSEASDAITIHKPEALNVASSKIEKAYKKILNHMPVANWIFSQGFYGGWLPMLCILMALYNDKRNLIPFVPILGSWVFLIMTPTVADRYILPFLYAAPLLIGLACHSFTQKNANVPR